LEISLFQLGHTFIRAQSPPKFSSPLHSFLEEIFYYLLVRAELIVSAPFRFEKLDSSLKGDYPQEKEFLNCKVKLIDGLLGLNRISCILQEISFEVCQDY
jgi:hypothetical protein